MRLPVTRGLRCRTASALGPGLVAAVAGIAALGQGLGPRRRHQAAACLLQFFIAEFGGLGGIGLVVDHRKSPSISGRGWSGQVARACDRTSIGSVEAGANATSSGN